MNRSDFQNISKLRLKEAKILLDNQAYQGAYYLLGYTIECALKAIIAKKTKRFTFPEKNSSNLYTHDLNALLGFADLKIALASAGHDINLNWKVVTDWGEEKRYTDKISQKEAEDIYFAIANRKSGILLWLKKQW